MDFTSADLAQDKATKRNQSCAPVASKGFSEAWVGLTMAILSRPPHKKKQTYSSFYQKPKVTLRHYEVWGNLLQAS